MCHKFFFSMKHFTQKIMDGCLCFLVEELRFLNSRMRLIFFSQVLGLLNVSQMVIFWCWSHGTGIGRQGMSDVQVIFW